MYKSIALMFTLLASTASAQTFNSGSNGSFGPITLAANENRVIDLPPDGIIHATTVTLGNSSRLAFRPNARNTPVYLLATGDVSFGTSALIDLRPDCPDADGISPGGPGGFAGGKSGVGDILPGAGQGPGGGPAGSAASHRLTYGTALLMPLVGGSGGGGFTNANGGGGGGAILIATSARIVTPSINSGAASMSANNAIRALATGQACTGGNPSNGSSGAIRLMASSLAISTTSLNLDVGSSGSQVGWCRVDTLSRGPTTLISCSGHADFPVRSLMQVFPPGNPRLDVTSVAGTNVPLDGGPVAVTLPSTAPAAQPVTIRAAGFTGTVPIRLRLTPENGTPVTLDGEIVMSGATGTVTLTPSFPPNVKTFVQVWTR